MVARKPVSTFYIFPALTVRVIGSLTRVGCVSLLPGPAAATPISVLSAAVWITYAHADNVLPSDRTGA